MVSRISTALAIGLAVAFGDHQCRGESSSPSAPTSTMRQGSAGAPPESAAAATSAQSGRSLQLVSLTVAAEPREAARVQAVAAELLARLAVDVHFRQVARIELDEIANPRRSSVRYLARAYIELDTPGVATLYLVDPVHDRVLVRRVEREAGGEEVTREQLGHILEASTEGLLAGMSIGRPRQEVAPTLVARANSVVGAAPPPAATPHTATTRLAHVSLLYEGAMTSAGTPIAHGPVLGLLGQRAIDRMAIGLWLLAQYRWSYELDAEPVGARIGGGALRVLATLDVREQAALSFRFALGGGVERVKLEPTSQGSDDVTLAPSRWLTLAVLRAQLAARLRVADSAHLMLSAVVDIDPSNTSYVFNARSGQQTVMRPWAVRPGLALGVELP